jgi:hypothetical protein
MCSNYGDANLVGCRDDLMGCCDGWESRWVLGGCSRSCEFGGVLWLPRKNEVGVGMDMSNMVLRD